VDLSPKSRLQLVNYSDMVIMLGVINYLAHFFMMIREKYLPFGVPNFSDLEIEAVTKVLRSGWVGMGAETLLFERELAQYVGANHVLCVNSCTSALFLALRALGIGPGDEVIVPSLTWCSTANAVLYLGATPVFCDVEVETMSASFSEINTLTTEKTRAVIYVHFGGLAGDMKALRSLLPPSVAIVEDAAHALGASYPDGLPVGSSGNLTCFSFYANKNLSTGDGGAVAVNDHELAEKVRLVSQQGLQTDAWRRYSNPATLAMPGISTLGYKMNFTDLQASIGRVQLMRQPEFRVARSTLAEYYSEMLVQCGLNIELQENILDDAHARHLFVIRLPTSKMKISRDQLLNDLRSRNVGASIHYQPLHTFPLYKSCGKGDLKNTEALMNDILTLPFGVNISDVDAQYVIMQFINCMSVSTHD
jgi:perosamine synthetase